MLSLIKEDVNLNQQEVKPAGNRKNIAIIGLIGGIGAVLLVPPFAYFGGGLLYWLSKGLGPGFCSIPLCLLSIIFVIVPTVTSAMGIKSSRKSNATVGLILSIVAICLGLIVALFGFIDAANNITGII